MLGSQRESGSRWRSSSRLALDDSMLDPAKIGILIGSASGGVVTSPSAREPGAAGEESK
jgi:hypothetical protein